jgi:hypothetical protein
MDEFCARQIDGKEEAKLLVIISEILVGRYPFDTPDTDGKNRMEQCSSGNAGDARAPTKHVNSSGMQ